MEAAEIHIPLNSLKELVVGSTIFRSSCDFHLSDADLEKSRRELKETKEVRNASLRELKEMLSRDQDIKYRTDDAYLLRYLRYRKFRCKEAYRNIRQFYVLRKEYTDIYHISSFVKSLLNSKISYLLPYTDEEGHLIFVFKCGNWKTDEMNMWDILRLYNLYSDIFCMNPHSQINGVKEIFDVGGANVSHASQALNPKMLRLWLKLAQGQYPWRIKRIIIFNCNKLQPTAITTMRYFMKKKISDRITVIPSDLNQLHEYINPALLPKEYGGNLEDSECHSYIYEPILNNLRYLQYEHSFIDT